jgi:hypothetical protein
MDQCRRPAVPAPNGIRAGPPRWQAGCNICGSQVSSDVLNEEPVKITHTNLVRESFLQDPYDRQRPGRNGLSERRKGSVMFRFPLAKV